MFSKFQYFFYRSYLRGHPPLKSSRKILDWLGIAWGETTTRDRTIIGSQEVFAKLMNRSTHPTLLKFDVIAAVAKQSDGTLNYEKLRHVIRILRPDRDGAFTLNSCNSFNIFLTPLQDICRYWSLLKA
jgi:hypothetical protein